MACHVVGLNGWIVVVTLEYTELHILSNTIVTNYKTSTTTTTTNTKKGVNYADRQSNVDIDLNGM